MVRQEQNRGEIQVNSTDPRIQHVLEGYQWHVGTSLAPGLPCTPSILRQQLTWDEQLNAPVWHTGRTDDQGRGLFRVLLAHSTLETDQRGERAVMTPVLGLKNRPEAYRTHRSNIHGTGIYGANRREATLRMNTRGRELGAYLTEAVTHDDIMDRRRRFFGELWHFGAMVIAEHVDPLFLSEAQRHDRISQRDRGYEQQNTKLVLINEAPRGRAEKLPYEQDWGYDLVPPQYILSRVPLQRIGTYERPPQAAQKVGALSFYTLRFWQALVRNARDMRRLGVGK